MWRFLLSYNGDELILDPNNNTAPRGWGEMGYTIQIDDLRTIQAEFSEKLGFNKAARTWIKEKIASDGLDISILCYFQRKTNYIWETIISGKLNVSDYLEDQFFLDVNVEDSDFKTKFRMRKNNETDYNWGWSIDGSLLPGFTEEFVEIELAQPGDPIPGHTTVKAVYPFEAFTKMLQKITDSAYMCLKSSILGRNNLTDNGFSENYAVNGDLSYVMISKGLLISQVDPNANDSKVSGKTDLVLQFEKIFNTFNAIKPLGIGVETINGINYFVIEKLDYFYKNSQYTFEIGRNEISELTKRNISEFFNSKIESGFVETKKDNDYGLGDFTGKVEYTSPLKNFKGSYSNIGDYSISPADIETARANPVSGRSSDEKFDTDEAIFLIDCYEDSGTIYSRDNDEGFISVSGVYGTDPIYTNLRLRPTQCIYNHGRWIKTGLQNNSGENLMTNSPLAGLSKVVSKLSGQSNKITDNANISIDSLDEDSGSPILSGYEFEFSAPLTIARIQEIQNDNFRFIKFWNYIDKQWDYGWIKRVSNTPTDGGKTNWLVWQPISVTLLSGGYMQFMDSSKGYIEFMDSSKGYIEFMAS